MNPMIKNEQILTLFAVAFPGPSLGWRVPFVIVAIPTIALATLMLFTVEEPSRGVTEAALQVCAHQASITLPRF